MANGDSNATLPSPTTPEDVRLELEGYVTTLGFGLDKVPLEKALRGKARKKIERTIIERLTKTQGGTPSDAQIEAALDNVSIADLADLGVRRSDFQKATRKDLDQRNITLGKHLRDADVLRRQFDLPQATGADGQDIFDFERGLLGQPSLEEATTTAKEADPARGAISNLEAAAIEQINKGQQLLAGDYSSPLGRDFLLGFNEQFNAGRATQGIASFGGGEANFQKSIGAQLAGQQLGSALVEQGIGLLGVAQPDALPQNYLAILDQMRSQNLFNDLFAQGSKARESAIRALNPTFGERLEAQAPGAIYGLAGSLLGGLGADPRFFNQQGG